MKTPIMASTLIDSVRSAFTTDVIAKMATLLGEPQANVQKATNGAISLILIDIIHKSHFPERVLPLDDLARKAANSDFFGEMHELSTSTGGLMPGSVLLNKGLEFSRALLGTRLDPVVNEISRYASISIPSASFVVGVVSFAALDAIGRHLANYTADGAGLPLWLQTHTDSTTSGVPSGLQVKEPLGIDEYIWEKRRSAVRQRSRGYAWIAVIIAIIVIIGLYFMVQRNRHPDNRIIAPADTTSTSKPDSTTPIK